MPSPASYLATTLAQVNAYLMLGMLPDLILHLAPGVAEAQSAKLLPKKRTDTNAQR